MTPPEDTKNIQDQECIVMARSKNINAGQCGFENREQM